MSKDPIIGIHLDMKGMQFKPSYFKQLFEDLASQRINTVLVEYEDIFPFNGIEIARDKETKWTKATLKKFQTAARDNNIKIIPLVQCLGHLEYLLCWPKYAKLSAGGYPSTIDVTNSAAVKLIQEMVRQVVEAHPDCEIVHLGMDEARGLHITAERTGEPAFKLFTDHLDALLPIVRDAGKKPYIWTDMVQDNFSPEFVERLKQQDVLMGIWDYTIEPGDYLPMLRFGGHMISKEWLKDLDNPATPNNDAGNNYYEDAPPKLKKLIKPHKKGRLFRRHAQLDIFTSFGMDNLPVGAIRYSANGSVLPPYRGLKTNLSGWAKAVKRCNAKGLIASSWARGTTWCPPNFCIDMTWPLINHVAKEMGKRPANFWPDLPLKTVDSIVTRLGRSREGWNLIADVASEIETLTPKVKTHKYEWVGMGLMARVMQWQAQADYNLAEVDFFDSNDRPVPAEWQRRLDEQKQTLEQLKTLRSKVHKHFAKRYHGEAFEEWIRHLFDLREKRIKDSAAICRQKKKQSRKFYAGK